MSAPLAPTGDTLVRQIVRVRGLSVLLDADLAVLYGVPNKELLRAVRHNECQNYDDETRARCLESANMSNKQHRLGREKVPVNAQ